MSISTDTEHRRARYRSLTVRNRIVAVLRIGLPALGILVVSMFFLQIFLASLMDTFRIGTVRFEGDRVAVDTPSYSGVMANGDVYKLSAEGASTAIANLDVIRLAKGELLLTKQDGEQMVARAENGAFNTIDQTFTVPGLAQVSDSAGNSGTLQHLTVDVPHQTLTVEGPVAMRFSDGGTLAATGLSYDATTRLWHFTGARLEVPDPNVDEPEAKP